MPTRFTHPSHLRYRSPSFSAPSTPLTDKKIKAYILAGRYGEEKKVALEKELAAKKKVKKNKPTVSMKEFKHLL